MATTRIRFNAEPQHRLNLGGGKVVEGGKEANVSAELAAELVAADYVDVSIVDGTTTQPKWPRSNAEIDEVARLLGVELPTPAADGSTKVTYADKVKALDDAGKTPADATAALAGSDNPKE